MTTPNAIAGVALRAPQQSYVHHPHLEAGVRLQRDGWLSGRGTITITPTIVWKKKYPNKLNQSASFELSRIALRWAPLREERDALAAELHHLLTAHALLSNPSYLTSEEPPVLKGAQRSLACLRRWRRALAEPGRYTYLSCQECKERSQKIHYERSSMPWPGRAVEALCPHAELVSPALGEVCQAFPELMFELLGLLSPEWDPEQPKQLPRRFSLTPEAFAYAMLSQLDANNPVHFPRYETHLYDKYHSIRLTPSATYKHTEQHSKERQEKTSCSALAWGITTPIQRLLKSPLPGASYPILGQKNPEPLPAPLTEISPREAAERRAELLRRLLQNDPSLQDFMKKLPYLTNEQQGLLRAIPMRQLADECLEIEEELADEIE